MCGEKESEVVMVGWEGEEVKSNGRWMDGCYQSIDKLVACDKLNKL
jgi:hypothetical protein